MFYLSRARPEIRSSVLTYLWRNFSSATSESITEGEKKISDVLQKRFTSAKLIKVDDVSGGCGAMFNVTVVSPEFKDLSVVKQHRMVTEALQEEIKQMHGLRISTSHDIEC